MNFKLEGQADYIFRLVEAAAKAEQAGQKLEEIVGWMDRVSKVMNTKAWEIDSTDEEIIGRN